MSKRTVSDITATEFENLTYDLLQLAGMKTLVWRTPGADGGRDIEGTFPSPDFSGYYANQKWYVECKFYTTSIDWPTIWKKVAYADSRGASFLLLVTNSNPSPNCETEIANWNAQGKNVLIRVWRGYEFDRLLKAYPSVAAKYGFLDNINLVDQSLLPMMMEMMKTAQASYVAHRFGNDIAAGLEASAALAELVSSRIDQIKTYGKMLLPMPSVAPPDYEWLAWRGPVNPWDEVGIRAFLSVLRHSTCATAMEFEGSDTGATILIRGARCAVTPAVRTTLAEVALWANVEVCHADEIKAVISPRLG